MDDYRTKENHEAPPATSIPVFKDTLETLTFILFFFF